MSDRGYNRLDMAEKRGLLCPFLGELGPRLIHWGLGRGLLPYQVASSSIQPFGHNRHGPTIGWEWVCPLFWGRGSWDPIEHKVAWAEAYPILSAILVHPAVWPQWTLAENWGLCPFRRGELGPHLTQCRIDRGLPHTKWHLDPCSRLATIDVGRKSGAPPLFGEEAGSPSNTKSPGLRPTSIPGAILMHPAVWPQ